MIEVVRRTVLVKTPALPDGTLVFYAMTGHETLGRPYQYDVELLSENPNLQLSELLGQQLSIGLELPDQTYREYNGIVTDFSFTEAVGRYAAYRVVVRPWVWLMSQRVGSRIFQTISVPDVIKQLFGEHGFSDYSDTLPPGHYRTFEYLVQYRESDLHFISRLMELEGIYYFFKHDQGKHELVLADSFSAHKAVSDYESVPYFPPQSGERRERDHLYRWQVRRAIRPGKFRARDFNFTRPGGEPMERMLDVPLDHGGSEYEVYDYPGKFQNTSEADVQVRVRLEELQADVETVQAQGNARGLGCGGLFKLTGFPRDDQNKQYLIIHAHYDIKLGDYESVERTDQRPDYQVWLVAMDSSQPYRAPRLTRKPVVEGPQTATVVGEAGQDIWTDLYGRVRLQFHWDLDGQANENTACWVRVSQAWAGSQWGSMHIPRIGQEVIVDFLEGDPDRPIVTGRVYNADNMPPYKLPDNQTQSGIKSRSTLGGTPDNFNEIRFEDKKGQEELYLQAEKNMTTLVKKDQTTTVKANRSANVTGSDSVSVGGDRSMSVTGNLSVDVKGGGKGGIQSSMNVTGKHNLHASKSIDMDAPEHIQLAVLGASIMIEPTKITITANGASLVIDGSVLATAAKGGSLLINPDVAVTSTNGGFINIDANVVATSSAGHSVTIDDSKVQLAVGGSTVDVESSSVTTNSDQVTETGGGSQLELAEAGATISGQKVSVTGTSMTEVTGATVKIN
jgi:type VI secretion system secreted protein VgrG